MSSARNRFKFDVNYPPRCQGCADKRRHSGEPAQRLVYRPNTTGYCIDCGAIVWEGRKKRVA